MTAGDPGGADAALEKSPAAATEMLQRLPNRGYVDYEPYVGATLTPAGRETARELHRTSRVFSRFFRSVLGLDDYEEEAMRLAGNMSPVVAERLSETLLPEATDADDGVNPSFLRPDSPGE